ncbi:MAG: 3'-5' exonuclease [Lachnospiraceae bacterium]|nr:3'-5' exonuclease [Lachnospiraceae bacterium]
MNSYICLDTEATGLSPKHDKIIEIGAVKVIDGKVSDTFSTFINPGRKLDERIVELTGIHDEDLIEAPEINEVIGNFISFCGELPLLGHHIISDYAIIKQAAINNKLTFDKSGVDTLKISRVLFPELESKRLKDMCGHLDISLEAHRALNDALATKELYDRLVLFYEENRSKIEGQQASLEVSKNASLSKIASLFEPQPLIYHVKKETPIRKHQKEKLQFLIELHKIDFNIDIDKMSCNEASRTIDKILAKYGK